MRRKHHTYFIGAEGERSAARDLEELKASGWHVFHDVTPRRDAAWNIDHVLIGPGGVYAIETKNWNKSDKNAKCLWDGTTLRLRLSSGARDRGRVRGRGDRPDRPEREGSGACVA